MYLIPVIRLTNISSLFFGISRNEFQWLHFGFVLAGVGQSNENGLYYIKQLSGAIRSAVSLSRGTPMHFVILRKK